MNASEVLIKIKATEQLISTSKALYFDKESIFYRSARMKEEVRKYEQELERLQELIHNKECDDDDEELY